MTNGGNVVSISLPTLQKKVASVFQDLVVSMTWVNHLSLTRTGVVAVRNGWVRTR